MTASTPRLSLAPLFSAHANGWKGSRRTGSADDILRHRFTFYGEMHDLGTLVDWEANPGTAHWGHDLNRFFFLEPLAEAFQATKNPAFMRKGVELILSWITQSQTIPVAESRYMWKSYLNVAIHLETWGAFLAQLDRDAPNCLTDSEFATVRESVQLQTRFLDRAIPSKTNNWVLIGCRGILAAVAFFPFLAEREEVCGRAWERLESALENQLLPDGVLEELSPHYHYTVFVCVLQALTFAPFLPVKAPPRISELAGKMVRYLRQTLTPDGYQAAFNDSDPAYGKEIEETLQTPVVQQHFPQERPLESEVFSWAGTIILREGSAKGHEECYLAFDAGPFGSAHQHEDKLSFWLSAFGRSFLVDPGRHLYDTGPDSRWPFLRTTAAHSTILFEGHGQNSRAAEMVPGAWKAQTSLPKVFERTGDGWMACASYDLGYGPERIPARHTRRIHFLADLQAWAIADRIDSLGGDEPHSIESRFQFAPGAITVRSDSKRIEVRTAFPDANLQISARACDWDGVRIVCGEPDGGWFSPIINVVYPAPCAAFSVRRQLPWQGIVALVPFWGMTVDEDTTSECFRRAETFS